MGKDKRNEDELLLEVGQTTDQRVNAVRPVVFNWEPVWRLNRAFRQGGDSVKKLGEAVLPKLDPEQTEEEYAIYLDQGIVFNAAQETADAWNGLIFKKDPVYMINNETPTEAIEEYLKHVTDTGMNADELLREITDQVIQTNRFGILLDYPIADEGGLQKSRAEQLANGDFSNALQYEAESIINWNYGLVNGKKVLVLLVLKEKVDTFNFQNFNLEGVYQYRVLTLEPSLITDSGVQYRQRVFVALPTTGDKQEFELTLDVFPTQDKGDGNGGIPLERIPFWIFNRAGQESAAEIKSPILDGVTQLNKGHFRNSADYENEIHKTSIKTPVIPGGLMEGKDLIMGKPLETAYPDSKPFIMESSAESPLAKEMKAKEDRMAYLGARALGSFPSNISAETARIQAASEESVLGDMANILASDYADMLLFKMQWDLGPDQVQSVSVELNTDFFENEINIPDLISAFGWLQSGGGSFETYYHLLERRNVYPKNWSMEKELEKIRETQTVINLTGGNTETISTGDVVLDEEGNPIAGDNIPVQTSENQAFLKGNAVTTARLTAESVAQGNLGRSQGVALLVGMGIPREQAELMMPTEAEIEKARKVREGV